MTRGRAFDLVIFDLDGTLVDSLPDIAWSLNDTLVAAGLPPLPLPTVRAFVGDGAAKLIARACQASGGAGPGRASGDGDDGEADGRDPTSDDANSALLSRFIATYATRVCVDSRIYPGIRELLDALTAAGTVAAVVTNKPGALARQLLVDLDIAQRFVAILGDGDGFPRKPDPTIARAALEAAGIAATRAVMVGDGLPDLRMARAIPCPSIAAAWGYVPRERLQAEAPTQVAPTVAEATRLLLSGWDDDA